MTSKKTNSWDSPENEAQNSFIGWNKIGDFVYGTLIGVKEVKSSFPGKEGTMQKIYTVKVKQSTYHVLDDKKKVVDQAVEPSEGDIINIGGRNTIDSRMQSVKLGQIVGLKYTEDLPSKTKGFNPTKLIKVFTPKDEKGSFEMDNDFLEEKKISDF